MKILFLLGEELQVADAAITLCAMGHEVETYVDSVEKIAKSEEKEETFGAYLRKNQYDFVLTHIFRNEIAHQTEKAGVKLAVYGMDSPMYHTWRSETLEYHNCYFFYFDKREYEMLKSLGHKNVYYLPLAANFLQTASLVITDEEINKYKCDLSFIGSLYSENSYNDNVKNFPAELQELFTTIMEESTFRWDGNSQIESFMTKEVLEWIKQICPEEAASMEYYDAMPAAYYIKQHFFGRKMTNIERTLLLNVLAEQYDLHLYTRATEMVPPEITRFPEVYREEAYKIFYASKINLNITLRSIESGIPMRIFDIMSVGGFVLSNYQEELAELFEEDKEIVLFRTPEEMIEKIDYYLSHEKARIKIGYNGYQKVKKCYTYEQQVQKLLTILFPE
ncbi:MAG: glycosyltransferase [Bacillus sp. (in: Bacteria)]|nr:glycosyltransferase [Bacillus sp. (in: firmicutes)]MCM1426689.1 glycosyltransferase [Eubacterium sp.]